MGFNRSWLSILGQDMIVTGLTFVSSVLIARWLGPVQLGFLYIINLIPAYAEKFGRVGLLDNAAVYYLGQKKYRLPEVATHLTWIGLLFGILPVILFAVFQDAFRAHFIKAGSIPDLYLWTAALTIPFIHLMINYNKLLLNQNRVATYNTLQIVQSTLNLSLCVFFWWRAWDLYGVLMASAVSIAVVTFSSLIQLRRITPFDYRINPPLIKDLFGYGWKLYAISLVGFLHQRFDLVLVALYLTPAQVSFYSMAAMGAQLLWKVPNAIGNILMPEVAKKKSLDAAALTAQACRNTFFILTTMALVMALFVYPAVRLAYGARYLPVVRPLWFILPGIVTMGCARVLMAHFYGQGHPRGAIIATVPATLLNMALNLKAIPIYGIEGAALVSSITYSLTLIILAQQFLKRWPRPLSDLFVIQKDEWAGYGLKVREYFS